uniref:Uncharacterized protein LOC114338408 n=1 Tax=Diabrotica virgifera virgifera TaxID=50390 RepID=A0A6P7GM07_DIAVI
MDSGKAQNLSDGERYVIALHTLFALSAITSYKKWKILNEVKSAGKFDDLVFESNKKCMLLQAKVHSGQTCTKHFMAIKGDFSIAKYFLSYVTAKKYFKITSNSLILCTAAKLNVADIMDEFGPKTKNLADENLQKIFGTETKKYKIKNEEEMVDKLLSTIEKFQNNISNKETEKDKKEWKELDINREDIKSFICFFVVVKIKLTSIKSLIKSKLSELNDYLKFKPSYYEYVKHHVEEWSYSPINKSVPMTEDYLMFIIYGENNRLFLHKFVNSKLKFKEANLYKFDSNIICVQTHDNITMHLLKIFRSIENTNGSYLPIEENTLCLMQKIENTFHKMKYTMEYKVVCDMIDTFRCDKIKYLVVSFLSMDEDKSLELCEKICTITKEDPTKKVFIVIKEHQLQNSEISVKIIKDKIYFSSLENETKEHIFDKEIHFQGEIVTLRKLITKKESIDSELEFRVQINEIEIDESLKEIIFSEDNYSIGSQAQSKPEELYVKRKLIFNANSLNLQKSINNVERTITILTDSDSDSYDHIRTDVFREKEFFEKIHKNIVVVTGPPGAGKTTLLKQIVSLKKTQDKGDKKDKKDKDKEDSKLTWIINVDLKKSKQFFQKDSEKTLCNLLYHNENITHYFEEKLMESMDKMLIIDGLDENCPEDIKEIQNVLADHNALQALNISMVIMGAREYDFILKEIIDLHSCEIVRLLPFSRRDGEFFLKEYLKINIKNALFKKVKNFAIEFSQSISSTPLSLKMISKIIKNSIRKGDSMESLSKVFNRFSNRYYFYNCYLEAIKDEFAQGDNIYRQAFDRYIDSLKNLAANNSFYHRKILSLLNVDASLEINKDVLNVGLLKDSYYSYNKGYAFVHKSFEEYFAAELLWDYLYKKRHNHDLLLEVLNEVFLSYTYRGVSDFFEQILEVNQNKKVSEISMEYNSALTKVYWKQDISRLYGTYFFTVKLVFDNYTNFYDILKSDNWKIIEISLNSERNRQSFANFFVETGAKVNKVNEIGFIILKLLLYYNSWCFKHVYGNMSYYNFGYSDMSDDDFESHSANSCIHNHEYAMDFLKILTRKYNIDLNFFDEDGNTIGHYAARSKSLNAIKYLKEQGANLSISNRKKLTLVHIAAQSGDLEVLRYLVEDCKLDVNVSDVDGNFAVHMIDIRDCNVKILKYLKVKGANLSISNKDKRTLIHEAARNGAFEVIRYLVEDCKMDVNVSDVDGNSPVYLVKTLDSNIKILKYFKEKGANLSLSNMYKRTLIHDAARNGAFEVIRYLVEDCKMDVNVSDIDGNLPVHMIKMRDDNVKIFKYLKEKGTNLSISNKKKRTLVHIAARQGAFEVLRYLVEDCKMDVNVPDVDGNLPAHMAAEFGKVEILKYLNKKGANLSIFNNQKQTLVHKAAQPGVLEVLQYLVEDCKLDVNVSDIDGNLPVHMMYVTDYDIKFLKYLKEKGANLCISNNQKQTLVHKAVKSGGLKVLQYLVEDCKLDVNVSDVDGNLPAHRAAELGYVETLKYLKDKGANLSISNNQNQTLVHKAVESGGLKVLRYLVEDCKLDVNVSDVDGNLPAHKAAELGYVETLKYLKGKGANLSISNNQKQTLVYKATQSGDLEVLKYLVEDCKMDVNVSDVNGNLPVHMAVEFSDVEILKYLKEKGANLSVSNNQKHTLVHKAAQSGYLEVLQYLVEDCKMDVNVSDVDGNLPVHMVYMGDYNVKILKYLKDQGAFLYMSKKTRHTFFHKAAQSGKFEFLQYLEEHCPMYVDVFDDNGNLPVRVINFNVKILKYLKDKGAHLCISNNHKHTLIHKAAQSGDLEVLQYLVEECKMNVNVSDVDGNLPAHLAASRNKVEILKYLKIIGNDLNQCNHQGATLVDIAVAAGAVNVLNFLKNECKFSVNLDL